MPTPATTPNSALRTLSGLSSFAARIRHCEAHFARISSGSGRRVYDLGDGNVLKLAMNEKGVSQNLVEGDYGVALMYPDTVNAPLDHCDDYRWIVSKRLDRVKEKDVADYYGTDWRRMQEYFKDVTACQMRRSSASPDVPYSGGDPVIADRWHTLSRFLMDVDVLAVDFVNKTSFGRDPDDGAIRLIDWGLTLDVWREHYATRSSAPGYGR